MDKKWMPITAGILDIIYGAFGVVFGLYAFIFAAILSHLIHREGWYQIMGPMVFIAGILSIISGRYIIKIRRRSLALIGSICTLLIAWAFFMFFINTPIPLKSLAWLPAILAIILTILSRNQFEK
jgi:hypothetical protein